MNNSLKWQLRFAAAAGTHFAGWRCVPRAMRRGMGWVLSHTDYREKDVSSSSSSAY
jgi:hypothetical protein